MNPLSILFLGLLFSCMLILLLKWRTEVIRRKQKKLFDFFNEIPASLQSIYFVAKFKGDVIGALQLDGCFYKVNEEVDEKRNQKTYQISFLWKEAVSPDNEYFVYYKSHNSLRYNEKEFMNLTYDQFRADIMERATFLHRMKIPQLDHLEIIGP